jgi:hypothetical protein
MGDAIPAAAEEPQDSKEWTTEFYHDSRQVALKLQLLDLCHRNPKRKHSGPLNRISKNEADLMAKKHLALKPAAIQ